MVFTEAFQKQLLNIIEASLNQRPLSSGEVAMLFHWVRNYNDPMYDFVPEKYKKSLPTIEKK